MTSSLTPNLQRCRLFNEKEERRMQQEVERMRAQHDDRLALMYREKSLTLNDLQLNRCVQTKTRLEPSNWF